MVTQSAKASIRYPAFCGVEVRDSQIFFWKLKAAGARKVGSKFEFPPSQKVPMEVAVQDWGLATWSMFPNYEGPFFWERAILLTSVALFKIHVLLEWFEMNNSFVAGAYLSPIFQYIYIYTCVFVCVCMPFRVSLCVGIKMYQKKLMLLVA